MTPQVYEIFELVSKANTKEEKIRLLQKYRSSTLKLVLSHAFDDKIIYKLPEGLPPYKPNKFPAGYADQSLYTETRRLGYLWINPPVGITKLKLEMLFIELLENLHQDDARILLAMKDKTLSSLYPSITPELVREAFPDLLPSLPPKTKSDSPAANPDKADNNQGTLYESETISLVPKAKKTKAKPAKNPEDIKKNKTVKTKKNNGESKDLQ